MILRVVNFCLRFFFFGGGGDPKNPPVLRPPGVSLGGSGVSIGGVWILRFFLFNFGPS